MHVCSERKYYTISTMASNSFMFVRILKVGKTVGSEEERQAD